MKAMQIRVERWPKGILGKLFGFVERSLYTYRVTVQNVGDENVGAKAVDADGRSTKPLGS